MNAHWPYIRFASNYYLTYALASVLVFAVAWIASTTGLIVEDLLPKNYNSYQCTTNNNTQQKPLRIMDVFRLINTGFADTLCKDAAVRAQYGGVEVVWQYRSSIDLRPVFDLHYDLLIAKDNLLDRANFDISDGYRAIIEHAPHQSHLISLGNQPVLSDQYLKGKKLGLMEDTNSQSGYRVPKSALKQSGVDESLFDIIYYKSHPELHQALRDNQVDLIASSDFTSSHDNTRKLVLHGKLPGPRWFLHPSLVGSNIHCSVLAAFRNQPEGSTINRFTKGAHTTGGCSNAK